ncbi:uncharacterized protein LOC124323722 [Daphnia pulicaria]|uniref:uncharacterized protein LOC124323722 n=1 Tax=Daphnia pulicaria TaxID=35523 RepID=UPI001EEB1553|nr:uncharacterized protein LOC124323722 [Daphnia pulicaria]
MKIGRKLKKTPVFKLVCKVFHKELAIFDRKLPPPVADKNSLYVHEGDEPIEEQTLAQDEAVLDNALQEMPTFRGEHLSDKIPEEFDSEVTNSDDDEAVTPVATEKNAPVDTAYVVSPLTLAPIARRVTNLPAVKPVAKKKNALVVTASNVSPLLIAPIGPSVTNLPTPSIVPLQKVSNPPTGTTIIHLPPN